jgi:hypothetical protein
MVSRSCCSGLKPMMRSESWSRSAKSLGLIAFRCSIERSPPGSVRRRAPVPGSRSAMRSACVRSSTSRCVTSRYRRPRTPARPRHTASDAASVVDLCGRRWLVCPMSDHPDAELAGDAIKSATEVRGGGKNAVGGVIFHADRGSTYTASLFTAPVPAPWAPPIDGAWRVMPRKGRLRPFPVRANPLDSLLLGLSQQLFGQLPLIQFRHHGIERF